MRHRTPWIKPARGLRKRCSHFTNQELCRCDWVVNYHELSRFNLTRWNEPLTLADLNLVEAETAFALLKKEVSDKTFDPRGRTGSAQPESAPVAAGPTLGEFLDTKYKALKFKKHGYHTDHLGDEWVMLRHVSGTPRRAPAASLGAFSTVLVIQRRWGKENLLALSEAPPTDWQTWFNELQAEREVSERTMNRYFAAVSNIFRLAIEAKLVTRNPCSKSSVFKKNNAAEGSKRDRRLSRDDEAQLIRICRARGHRPISDEAFRDHSSTGWDMYRRLIGALDTGLREDELLRVRVRHVKFEHDDISIVLPADAHKGGQTTGEDRVAFAATPRVKRMLRRRVRQLKAANGFIFGREDGTVCVDFAKTWKTLFRMVGLGGTRDTFTWHDLKHEFMSKTASRTQNPEALRVAGGHSDLRTSMQYITVHRAELLNVASQLTVRKRQTTQQTRRAKTA